MDNLNKPATGEPQNPQVIQPTNVALGVAVGIGVAFVFGMGGFLLVNDDTGSMGAVLFLLLPFATGFATALVARRWNIVVASLIIGFIICSTILLVSQVEGWVCVLMSFPLIAVGMTIGALLGALVRRQLIDKSRRPRVVNLVLLLVIPVFLMGANNIEKPSRRIPREETFTSVLVLNTPAEKVWNAIKSMDRVNAHKGFLMRIGLPVPVSCSIDKEAVGGKRTCYFESGYIEERITEWEPPRSMKLEITSWDVPGRPWLDFKDASYEFHEDNGQTIMTRTTTIVSRLLPAWYWRRFEEIGVKTEHEYLFEAVKNGINGEK
ncbi:MAG: hypothetical protein M3R69_11085 [Acidobacteriota bacterium]|nr:hypothetical protein [Acidobacteriota bacterium]